MDGCWEPWLIGCVIDWQAWSAIGTLLAVVTALWLAAIERSNRQRREWAESRLIARDLADKFGRFRTKLLVFADDLDLRGQANGLTLDLHNRERLWRMQLGGGLTKVPSMMKLQEPLRERLHLLAPRSALTVLSAFEAGRVLNDAAVKYGDPAHTMREGSLEADGNALRLAYIRALNSLTRARQVCLTASTAEFPTFADRLRQFFGHFEVGQPGEIGVEVQGDEIYAEHY